MKLNKHNQTLVRAARVGDAAQIASLAQELLTFEKSLNDTMGELTSRAANTDEIHQQLFQSNTKFFIAEKEGEVIGYIKVLIHGRRLARSEIGALRWLMDLTERTVRKTFDSILRRHHPNIEAVGGYIAGAFVRPEARQANTGRLLVNAAEEWLRGHAIDTCELHVLYANEGARRFWEEIGYTPVTMGMKKRIKDEG
jgi:GNAT superfamily N-acetyltransferase